MSTTTISHPAIQRVTTPLFSFLDYIASMGAKVTVTTTGQRVHAQIDGLYRFHPPSDDGPESTSPFATAGSAEAEVLALLAERCSGAEFSRRPIQANWSVLRKSQRSGDGHFPQFKSP